MQRRRQDGRKGKREEGGKENQLAQIEFSQGIIQGTHKKRKHAFEK